MTTLRSAVLLGGAVVAGASLARRHAAEGAELAEPVLPPMPAGRSRTVRARDGVDLAVTEHGAGDDATDATATLVLLHGYVQSSVLWSGQVRDVLEARPDLRVVTYDHRGHGRSGPVPRDAATFRHLADDLLAVLDAVAATGPVVVAGHSMGGMTIMALAEEHPELFGARIAGVGFLATSSGGLDAVTHGLPAPVARVVKRALPALSERAVRAEARGLRRPVGRMDARVTFPPGVDAALVRAVLDVHRECSAHTMAAFLPAISEHDRLRVLATLTHVPSVVVAGDRDLLTPLDHGLAIADALPESELTVFPGVGHMVHLERRAEVSRALLGLVDRAVPARVGALAAG